ncbi:biotin--[acetyl-CoA-carboxylase] ligase [Ectothiorhodospiraceae bacterium BW-2]|nr:biotin--[acetyl-CoA-carboxylase] ligase [Ectothiorhodospiraceae bacterium BW-2]
MPTLFELQNRIFCALLRSYCCLSRRYSIEIFDQIDSTNSYLLQRSPLQSDRVQLLFARRQTAGRGQYRRQWLSPETGNLYLSIGFGAEMNHPNLSQASLLTGVLLITTLQNSPMPEPIKHRLQLKWPNDLWLEGAKVGGVLTEQRFTGQHISMVIGLGVNFSGEGLEPLESSYSYLSLEAGAQPVWLAQLLQGMDRLFCQFDTQYAVELLQLWPTLDALWQQPLQVQQGERVFYGTGAGIDSRGHLLLSTQEGVVALCSGSVVLC